MTGFFSSSLIQKEKPPGQVPLCGLCQFYKGCNSPKMKPYGNGKRKVLVLGEAPGRNEDEQGRPFVGLAGQLLRDSLEQIGIDLDEDCWTTNAVICRPKDNATPKDKNIRYCRPNLTSTIEKYNPRVIICLGKTALRSALMGVWDDVKGLERWVGSRIPTASHWICPTYHPSYLLRVKDSMLNRFFREHLEAAFAITKETREQPDWEQKIVVELDEGVAAQAVMDIGKSEWVAFDYETNCLKPEWSDARLYTCAVSNGKRTVAFPWSATTKSEMGKLLLSKRSRKIASNLQMEERWTRKEFGVGVRNWGWDTMLAAHALDNRPGICGLKYQSFVQFGVPAYNKDVEEYLESHHGPYNRIAEVDLHKLLFYNGMDALLEWKLAMRQRRVMGYED